MVIETGALLTLDTNCLIYYFENTQPMRISLRDYIMVFKKVNIERCYLYYPLWKFL